MREASRRVISGSQVRLPGGSSIFTAILRMSRNEQRRQDQGGVTKEIWDKSTLGRRRDICKDLRPEKARCPSDGKELSLAAKEHVRRRRGQRVRLPSKSH